MDTSEKYLSGNGLLHLWQLLKQKLVLKSDFPEGTLDKLDQLVIYGPATTEALGVVRIGNGIQVDETGEISIDARNLQGIYVTSAAVQNNTVARQDIVQGDTIKVNDILIAVDRMYTVTAVTDDTVTLQDAGVSLKGSQGSLFYTANYNVMSNSTVMLNALTGPGTPRVNDLVIDTSGDLYYITAVQADNVRVGNALSANIKGPQGEAAQIDIITNQDIDAMFS